VQHQPFGGGFVAAPALQENQQRVAQPSVLLIVNLLTSLIAGLVVFVTLTLLGVPFPLLWALWVALVDFLPMIGGALAGIPTVVFALGHSLTAGIVTAAAFLIYQQIENHVLNPVIMSRTANVNPLLVLLSLLVGTSIGDWVGGFFGSFVGALLLVALAVGLFGLLPRLGGLTRDAAGLRHARPAFLVAAIAAQAVSLGCYAQLYRRVLAALGARIRFRLAAEVIMATFFVSHLTPFGSATGTLVNASALEAEGIAAVTTGEAIALTSLTSTVALIFLFGTGFVATAGRHVSYQYLLIAGVAIFLVMAVLAVVLAVGPIPPSPGGPGARGQFRVRLGQPAF
jgi:AI-2E family transporter